MSDKRPFLTMTLIAKDERHNVDRCFASFWPWVDEVVLIDTGSTDGTVEKARQFARKRKQLSKLKVGTFEWCDDFAAARQVADDLATGEFLVWCDLDDTIEGLGELRKLAEHAGENVAGFFCHYSYARDPNGNTISELWRERVVRNDGVKWTDRLHEHKQFGQSGRPVQVIRVPEETARWVHHRNHEQRTGERNLRILQAWGSEQPDDPRIVSAIAMELMGADRHKDASDMFARLLAMPGVPPDQRAQASRHMCVMLLLQGRVPEARAAAYRALEETWMWADTHLTLAEVEQTLGHPDVAIQHAQQALTLGKPDTILIVNPQQYAAQPRAQMERFEEAVQMAQECLQVAPGYPLPAQMLPMWQGQLKRQQTIRTILALADVYMEVGELARARDVIAAAPYFVREDLTLLMRKRDIVAEIGRRRRRPVHVDDEAADRFVARYLEAV
jgi:tetratricopeptide (TPR) repeat protein